MKLILIMGVGLGVLVWLAGAFQPGKNSKGALNTNSGQPAVHDRFARTDEVGPLGKTRLEYHDGKMYQVTYKPGYGRR
jgi:hypothetical protein